VQTRDSGTLQQKYRSAGEYNPQRDRSPEKGLHRLRPIALGNYALALKGNQGTLQADVSLFLDDPETRTITTHTTVDGDHGRIETRTSIVSTVIDWLQDSHQWPGLAAIGKVIRTRETPTKTTTETADYLFSTPLSAEHCGAVVRAHWGVENSLHWRLDVTMNEDQARNHKDNGPENLAVFRHLALNLVSKDTSKGSLRVKLLRAAWNTAFLRKLLAQI
jgi:predicted transposase YbfD/YdcC